MNKKILIFILYALVLATVISRKLYIDNKNNIELKTMIVKQESQSLAALTLALRKIYQKEFIKNHIPVDSITVNLLPVRTANDISKEFSNLINNKTIIRTVSDRPRNPKNKANKNEMKIISFFNKNPNEKSYFINQDTSYYYAVPLRIKQSCLKCHGKREDATPVIRNNYKTAYNYKLGELRGIISINMTKRKIIETIVDKQKTTIISAIFMFIILILVGVIIVNILIKGERKFTKKLEQKVKEKTRELENLNKDLKFQNENASALNEELNQSLEELTVTKDHLAKQKQLVEQSEEKFKAIFNSSSAGITIMTYEGVHIDTNSNCEKIHGYTREELIGKKFRDFSHPEDIEISQKAVMSLLKGEKEKVGIDVRLIHKNTKEIVWIHAELTKYVRDTNTESNDILVIFNDITKHKLVEQTLKENEEKFRKITNSANDAIILVDNNEKIALWNTAAQNIFGYTEEEILGKNLHDILPAIKYREKAHQAFGLFRQSGKGAAINKTVEVEGLRKNGDVLSVELSLSAIKIKGKWNAIGIIRDISVRKEYDRILQESKEKNEELVKQFNDTIENLEDVYFKTDRGFIYREVSPSIKKHLELDNTSQIIGKPLTEFWEITEEEVKQLTVKIFREKFIKELLFNYKTLNGEIKYAKINARTIYKNNKFNGVEGMIRDVTNDIEYRNKIKDLNTQKQVLINNIPSAIYYKDKDLKYLEVNKHFAKLLNLIPSRIIGKTDKEVASENIMTEYEFLDKEILRTKEPVINYIKKHKDTDGKEHWISTSKIPYLDSDNNVAGIIGVVRDITEQVEYENSIKSSKAKIEEAHKHITDNINYAKTIQQALLPTKDVIASSFNDYFVLFNPKDQVSGDFYYLKKFNDFVIFSTADCTGHGVSGGFLTMLAITNLNDIVSKRNIKNPGKALNLLRDKIKKTYQTFGSENKNGLDIALCALNTKTNLLHYAGAYNPLWIIRNNELIEYRATRNPIGFYLKEVDFEYHEIQLQKDDNLYIFSDGYADQFGGEEDKKFTAKRFKQLLLSNSNLPMNEQKNILEETFNKWKGNVEQTDDVVVMGIKI